MIAESNRNLRLPCLFSDGMILQREQPVKIWGCRARNCRYSDILGKRLLRKADNTGAWVAVLPPAAAGGPHTLEVSAYGEVVTLSDVLVGDVWLCSGQSNMQLPMERVDLTVSGGNCWGSNPLIRQFKVPERFDFRIPRQDLDGGVWVAADPKTVLDFSAVGYFFAKELYEKYQVPIGL